MVKQLILTLPLIMEDFGMDLGKLLHKAYGFEL